MKVLVFGLGLNEGGVGSARFFAKKEDSIRVTDLKNADILKPSIDALKDFPQVEYTLGGHKFEDIDWADLIIKNPAVKRGNPYIEYATKSGKKVETDMRIFLQHVKPSQIFGVTGTKGKSTVASLIYEVLHTFHLGGEAKGHPRPHLPGEQTNGEVLLAGNIGKSVLDTLEFIKPDTLVILEISSFQLEAFEEKKVSPKWAVITNIYPDHLNYYSSMEEYISWKKVIDKYQTSEDFLFIRKNDPVIDTAEFLGGVKSQIVRFSADDLPENFNPTLQGKHNLENIAVAYEVSKLFGISENEALKILSSFKGVEFRMQLIYEWDGVKIYNDTTATTPDAAIAAIKSLGVKLIHPLRQRSEASPPGGLILIAGGMNKNLNYSDFARVINNDVRDVFFLEGDATDLIISSLRETTTHLRGEHEVTPDHTSEVGKSEQLENLNIHGPYSNLETLLADVKDIAKSGDTILFSPAATSFNLFQNEFDRGRKFNEAVEKIFK